MFGPPAGTVPTTVPLGTVPGIVVARQVAEPTSDPAPEPAAVTSVSETAPPPGSTGTPAGAASTGSEPEELLKKLFDPLLRRLKVELRIDRERRGSLTDLRY